jgi:hypothetical protein
VVPVYVIARVAMYAVCTLPILTKLKSLLPEHWFELRWLVLLASEVGTLVFYVWMAVELLLAPPEDSSVYLKVPQEAPAYLKLPQDQSEA